MKKIWTAAARKAFALKMKRARAAKRGRRRSRNPTRAELKTAAGRVARAAGKLAWRGAKLTGRTAKASARAAAAEVKASICRTRAKNPGRRRGKSRRAILRKFAPIHRARSKRIAKLRRMRARHHNPIRVVIKAVPKGEYRKRSKNPTTPLYYDGRNFSAVKTRRKYFSSVQPAEVVARQLLHQYPILRKGYVVTLNSA